MAFGTILISPDRWYALWKYNISHRQRKLGRVQSAPFVFCLKKLGWCRHFAMLGYWRGIWNGSTSCSDLVWIAERTKLGFNFSQGLLQVDQPTNVYGKNTLLWIPSFIMNIIYIYMINKNVYTSKHVLLYVYIWWNVCTNIWGACNRETPHVLRILSTYEKWDRCSVGMVQVYQLVQSFVLQTAPHDYSRGTKIKL